MTPHVGIDPGANSGLAVVKDGRCIFAASVYGSTWRTWLQRAWTALDHVPFDAAVAIEEPEPVIRKSAGMANHRSGFGLGLRAGAWLAILDARGHAPTFFSTGEWWNTWHGTHHFHGKSKAGKERVTEAIHLVPGAGAWLEEIPVSRKVDVAEAILIAGGMARR